MKIKLLAVVLIWGCVFGNTVFAQNIQWQNTIGGSANDELYSISQTIDGGYICGGWTYSNISGDKTENSWGIYDYWMIKLDTSGNIQWQNNIGGSLDEQMYSICQTSDGGYICGGASSSNISGDKTENSVGGYDYWVIKIDTSGNIQWQNSIGGNSHDYLRSISQTLDGGYICGGSSSSSISGDKTENSLGSFDYWVIKLDALGNIQWQNTLGGIFSDQLSTIAQTADGGYISGGTSNSNISGDKTENSLGGHDYWLVKLDALGNIQWQNTIGGNDQDALWSTVQTFEGGYICGGTSSSSISGDKTEDSLGFDDYWVVKLDSLGNIQWQNTIGGSDYDRLWSIVQATDSGYICGGFSRSNISDDKTENNIGEWDCWVIKLDTSGNIKWQNTIGGSDQDALVSISQTSDEGYVCGGFSRSNISGDKTENNWDTTLATYDYWIIKINDTNITTLIPNLQSSISNLQLYPNPATDKIYISFPAIASENITVKIYSVTGENLFQSSETLEKVNATTIDVAGLLNGIYFLSIQTGREVVTRKIVVNH